MSLKMGVLKNLRLLLIVKAKSNKLIEFLDGCLQIRDFVEVTLDDSIIVELTQIHLLFRYGCFEVKEFVG